jgi:uncharacterized protein (TIGR02145 family)
MKFIKKHHFFFILFLFLLVETSCKKDLLKFVSVTPGTFTDTRDGQVYKTTTIGSYTWLAQNLNFKTDSSCYYNNDSIDNNVYGRLYNWQAAQDAVPPGWHLPSQVELEYLYNNLGNQNAGCQMMETGNLHWGDDNSCADNYSGLTILPGGIYYSFHNQFDYIGENANFWGAGQGEWAVDPLNNMGATFYADLSYPQTASDKMSVRCVKNY